MNPALMQQLVAPFMTASRSPALSPTQGYYQVDPSAFAYMSLSNVITSDGKVESYDEYWSFFDRTATCRRLEMPHGRQQFSCKFDGFANDGYRSFTSVGEFTTESYLDNATYHFIGPDYDSLKKVPVLRSGTYLGLNADGSVAAIKICEPAIDSHGEMEGFLTTFGGGRTVCLQSIVARPDYLCDGVGGIVPLSVNEFKTLDGVDLKWDHTGDLPQFCDE